MVYSWTIHGYEFQESNILNHELLMNSSWIVHGSANRFYTMNSSWFTHEQFMVMNFRKAGQDNICTILAYIYKLGNKYLGQLLKLNDQMF